MYGANAGQVGRLGIDATTNQAILAIVSDTTVVDPEFLYHSVSNVVPLLMRKVQGSGQPNLSAGIVEDQRILVPKMSSQTKIAQIASAQQTILNILQALREQLCTQKRGLMQKLLTGEWRLDGRFDLRATSNDESITKIAG